MLHGMLPAPAYCLDSKPCYPLPWLHLLAARHGPPACQPSLGVSHHWKRTMTWSAPTTEPAAASTEATTPSASERRTLDIFIAFTTATCGMKRGPSMGGPGITSVAALLAAVGGGAAPAHLVSPADVLAGLHVDADQRAGHGRPDDLRRRGGDGGGGAAGVQSRQASRRTLACHGVRGKQQTRSSAALPAGQPEPVLAQACLCKVLHLRRRHVLLKLR